MVEPAAGAVGSAWSWWARWRPYRVVLASRARSQVSYRVNFGLDLLSSLLVALVELAEVWVLFRAVSELGGLDFQQMLLVFGLADAAFSLADLFFGHCDELARYVRAGTFDVFCLRPQPLLAHLVTSDLSLRRLARASVGVVVLFSGLVLCDVRWGVAAVVVLVSALVSGVVMFSALFVWAAGLQFFLVDGSELTNAVVYGGRYAATQPASVWSRPLVVVFGFFFPMAFAGYLPTLVLLGLPGPVWLPSWLGWCAPVAAGWACALAGVSWRWDSGSLQRSLLLPRLFFQHFTDSSCLIDDADGRLVAFLVGFLSQSEPETAYIHFVGVDPSLRRRGLAEYLYQRFFRFAAGRGRTRVRCVTSPGNATSLAFHTGLGFQLDYDGPGLHRIAFTRALDGQPLPVDAPIPPDMGPARRAGKTDLGAVSHRQ